MASPDPTVWSVASLSDTGRVRSDNEDRCGTFENAAGARLLVVADGMGGHRGGATASRLAVEALEAALVGAEDETSPFTRYRAHQSLPRISGVCRGRQPQVHTLAVDTIP